ncbi:hypothetical protein [Enterococcus casseliflavus]|uniref:hypothetical protein n=1 Tax=Enterococcus casseliflavus TaxID=37734 RepID=UPI001BCEE72A|nr:hypothetical protein [Enterococcus casseliflavus]
MNTVSILFAQLVSSEEDMAKYDTFYSKCNDRFDALCDLKEKKLNDQPPTLQSFEEVASHNGIAEACNSIFYSGLSKDEAMFLDRTASEKNVSFEDVFNQLSNNYFKNPLRIVL